MTALDLLSGDARTFVEEVWASRVLSHRGDPDELVSLLTLADADRLLTASAIRTPAVRVAQDGSVLPASRYTRRAAIAGESLTGLVDGRKVLELFDGGASIVFQGLHRYWPPLTALVAELEEQLGHPCQANAYLTPPGSQGFAVHSDSHDVFVFQTHGTKLWEVHHDGVREELLLEPGVSMYLPTGTPHAARAEDSVSLHVTIGINQLTWRTVLQGILEEELAAYEEHLPAGYLDEPQALADALGDRIESLAKRLTAADPGVAAERQVRRFTSSRPPRLAGSLVDRASLPQVDDDTALCARPGRVLRAHEADGRLDLYLGDRVLSVPVRVRAGVDALAEALRTSGVVRPRDLAATLDPQSRLVLCRRLIREGLLTVDR